MGWVYLGRGDLQRATEMWKPAIEWVDDVTTLKQMADVFDRMADPAAASAARAALARRMGR